MCDFFADEPVERRRAAARLIALARKKMNNNGKHWVKGTYHRMRVIVKGKPAESCYCMVGGLNAAGRELTEGRVKGDLALAKKMVASTIKGEEVSAVTWNSHMRWGQLCATSIIINKNDSYKTTWQDVNTILKDAAAALRRKPKV